MRKILAFGLIASTVLAQTAIDLSRQTINGPVIVGATPPATCQVGQIFFSTSAPAGSNLYGCTAANTWTGETAATTTPTPAPVPAPTPSPVVAAPNGSASYTAVINSASVPAGQAVTITADRPTTWTLSGPGAIVSQSGSSVTYSAPSNISAPNSVSGCAVLPVDSIYNAPIDSLPVHPSSSAWITQALGVASVGVSFGQSWGINVVDSKLTPSTKMTFYYTTSRNGLSYPLLTGNNRNRETGALPTDGGNDHHMVTLAKDTCHFYETYHDYLTGLTPNSQWTANSGYDYTSGTYTQPTDGATDAAGLPITPLTVHLSEIQAGAIKHAMRFTSCAGCIGSPALWPAVGTTAATSGAAAMGSRWRLKASYDISKFSPKAQIVLAALQHYGMILADIGGIGQVQVSQDINLDPDMQSVFGEIQSAQINQNNFEIVDESSLMVNVNSSQAAHQATSAILTGNDGKGNTITVPVAVQPVLIGTPYPAIYPQAGTPYQLQSWVTGSSNSSVSWSLLSGPGSVTAGGIYTPPASVTTPTKFTLKAVAQADSTNPAYVSGTVIPSGAIRIDAGNTGTYVDSKGNTWMADNIGVIAGSYNNDNESYQYPAAKWGNIADWQLYSTMKYTWGDDISYGPFVVPNGTYNVAYYFAEPNCAGPYDEARSFDNGLVTGGTVGLDVNGTLTMYSIGAATKDTCLVPAVANVPVTVTNNVLTVAVRAAGADGSHQAPFINALQITSR